jgi:hypothetical protein
MNITPTTFRDSWFQAFAIFWMSCVTFWVVLRRMVFNSRRFGTLCLFHLHRQVDAKFCIHLPMKMEQPQCSKMSAIKHHTPEKTPRRLHTTYRTQQKLEIMNFPYYILSFITVDISTSMQIRLLQCLAVSFYLPVTPLQLSLLLHNDTL